MLAIQGAVQDGLIYALLTLGVYITFKVLNTPDLTAEGSFTMGMAISGVFTADGNPILALVFATVGGMLAGVVTGVLHTKMKIHPVLAGILTMFGLQSINFFIMGQANIPLMGKNTVFRIFDGLVPASVLRIAVPFVFCLVSIILLKLFFDTQLGLSIRATGDNEEMVKASSINVDAVKIISFAVANGFIALSGGLMAQSMGSADINFGMGIVTIGLASVIIGELFFGKRGITIGLISAAVGAVVYRLAIAFALSIDLFPAMALKLISAIIIGAALAIPAVKQKLGFLKTVRTAEAGKQKDKKGETNVIDK